MKHVRFTRLVSPSQDVPMIEGWFTSTISDVTICCGNHQLDIHTSTHLTQQEEDAIETNAAANYIKVEFIL